MDHPRAWGVQWAGGLSGDLLPRGCVGQPRPSRPGAEVYRVDAAVTAAGAGATPMLSVAHLTSSEVCLRRSVRGGARSHHVVLTDGGLRSVCGSSGGEEVSLNSCYVANQKYPQTSRILEICQNLK